MSIVTQGAPPPVKPPPQSGIPAGIVWGGQGKLPPPDTPVPFLAQPPEVGGGQMAPAPILPHPPDGVPWVEHGPPPVAPWLHPPDGWLWLPLSRNIIIF